MTAIEISRNRRIDTLRDALTRLETEGAALGISAPSQFLETSKC
jgi:hypothetical protein